jgi:hypothetical protein
MRRKVLQRLFGLQPNDQRLMYKIPRRHIWCETFSGWVYEMLWVFIVLKVFRHDIEQLVGTPPSSPPA